MELWAALRLHLSLIHILSCHITLPSTTEVCSFFNLQAIGAKHSGDIRSCLLYTSSTGADSLKTIDFLSNPKAGLCFQDKGDSVALTGKVEVVTDEKMKQELWQDWFIDHFPGGPTDPGYVLLKFESNHATYWIEGTFIHKKLD